MPYYQGDYYQGDYYQGDIFGKLKRGLVGAVKGFVSGGPLGAVRGAAEGVGSQVVKRMPAPAPPLSFGPQGVDVPRGAGVPEPGMRGAVQRLLPFGQTGYGAAPPGYHVNKAYVRYLRAQDLGKDVQNPFSEPRAVNLVVRNRRMNPLNVRALRSSVRRQKSMASVMRRALSGSGWTVKRSGLGGGKRRSRGKK